MKSHDTRRLAETDMERFHSEALPIRAPGCVYEWKHVVGWGEKEVARTLAVLRRASNGDSVQERAMATPRLVEEILTEEKFDYREHWNLETTLRVIKRLSEIKAPSVQRHSKQIQAEWEDADAIARREGQDDVSTCLAAAHWLQAIRMIVFLWPLESDVAEIAEAQLRGLSRQLDAEDRIFRWPDEDFQGKFIAGNQTLMPVHSNRPALMVRWELAGIVFVDLAKQRGEIVPEWLDGCPLPKSPVNSLRSLLDWLETESRKWFHNPFDPEAWGRTGDANIGLTTAWRTLRWLKVSDAPPMPPLAESFPEAERRLDELLRFLRSRIDRSGRRSGDKITGSQDGDLTKRVQALERERMADSEPTLLEKIRTQRIKFACPRRTKPKPDSWRKIYIAYSKRYPKDTTADRHTLRHSHDRNCQKCRKTERH